MLLEPVDQAMRRHLRRVFARTRVNLVIDVGARQGEYGCLIRQNGYDGRLVSFEPVSESFRRLSARVASDARWLACNMALGSMDGTAEINVTEDTFLASFLQPNATAVAELGGDGGTRVRAVETVEVRRLDSVWALVVDDIVEPRVFLKMDTQGWDLEVLAGAAGILDQVVAIQSEVSVQPLYEGQQTEWRRVIEILDGLGFALSGLFPVGMASDLRVIEFDCIAIRGQRSA
jgi:FkbM family methyltransferase